MRRPATESWNQGALRRGLAVLALGLALVHCGSSDDDAGTGATAGATPSGVTATASGVGGAGTGGATGTGGAVGGAGAATGSGGATTGSGGTVAGSGGAATGAGGPSGGSGGTGGSGGGVISDDFVGDVEITVLDFARTVLEVTWTQTTAADETWLEFTFEEGNVMTSPRKSGEASEHREVVLGVPGETDVTIRVVSSQGGMEYKTSDYMGTTGTVPAGMPAPEVIAYDPELASDDRWMFGAVEDSDGGCASQACFYHTTFWLYIMDRQGRIVWYYADAASNATSSFQRIARDGQYIWIEKRPFSSGGSRSVLKMTLDREYMVEIGVPNLSDCIDVTDDGSLLYDTTLGGGQYELREMNAEGDVRPIWNCRDTFPSPFQCYSNTVNWNEADGTVLLSFPDENTVVEIDRDSGDVVGQYGDAPGSWAFSPDTWEFEFQHFANITPEGTLLVSSHMPGYEDTRSPVAGQHAFMEFERDSDAETLIYKWHYQGGDTEWAMFKGMAIRLPNGNTLGNYGTGGVIKEVTEDKQVAFHVKFDVEEGNDFFNKMVGHNVLIDDLYALNGGGPD